MARTKAKNQDNGDEFSFMASQASNGSDDQMLQQALAERVFATKEKKKKETEKKFLAAAQKHLLKEVTNASANIQSTYQAANEEFQRFTMEYASIEDEIRALWDRLHQEQQLLASTAEKRRNTLLASAQTYEAKHIKAMGLVKEACNENDRIVTALIPQNA
ncbi:uncharacterized protein EV420DRAFT_1640917 [Desarmillaria tabescens]|uniref:Uncharacterized protein n=1 Tax=Armillaria tabescens TaxID=1929756 RepID=A0AA39TNZ1_ARMTA|nr:uncharacterized protein EV420DRAFT_1640917 [Desarmillaria tabescens]KAK0461428.1 hypothetical protein EV420DRAFT_1640917 [Desarmillaria tabescens]